MRDEGVRDEGLGVEDYSGFERILELKSLISHPSSLIPAHQWKLQSTLTFVRASLSTVNGQQLTVHYQSSLNKHHYLYSRTILSKCL